jgi:hypothetical protein
MVKLCGAFFGRRILTVRGKGNPPIALPDKSPRGEGEHMNAQPMQQFCWQEITLAVMADIWPRGGGGFEYFYGFIGGETNQYQPALYDCTTTQRLDRKHPLPSSTSGYQASLITA